MPLLAVYDQANTCINLANQLFWSTNFSVSFWAYLMFLKNTISDDHKCNGFNSHTIDYNRQGPFCLVISIKFYYLVISFKFYYYSIND